VGRKRRKKREKEKRKRKKRKGEIGRENEIEKWKKKYEGVLEKLGEFLGKLEEGFLRIFLGFSDTGVNSGTAVTASRTGQWDRGLRGIPGVVADRGAGAARDGRRPERRRCRRDSRHARRREKNCPGFRKGVNELSGKVLKTHVIY
jgi:hypothetical protein